MSEPRPLLDDESPWPVSTGTLGRTYATNTVGPGESEPEVAWTYEHDAGLVAPPVVTRSGGVVLLDEGAALSTVTPEGQAGWSTTLEVTPVQDVFSPAVWRRGGRSLISVAHEGGVSFVEAGGGVVDDVTIEAPDRFIALREDGLVVGSRERFALLDDDGAVIDEHRFAWRSDDVALPTVGPDGAVYFLENREYSPSWDSESQFLEVARISFDGGAGRESVFAAHAHSTDAIGSLCATVERLVWILDSWRLGCSYYGGESEELDLDAFPSGEHPSRILGGSGTTVLLQREEVGQPVYGLAGRDLSTWPVEEPVEGTVIDAEGTAYLLTVDRLRALASDGTISWTTDPHGEWMAAAEDALLVSTSDGAISCLERPL